MKNFLRSLSGLVVGVLSGFDRLMFRGHLRTLNFRDGLAHYCLANRVLFKDFKVHAQERTAQLIAASEAVATQAGRPVQYLRSAGESKEQLARELAHRDGIDTGLIGVFSCLEPCTTYTVRGNRATKRLEFRSEFRKRLHLYHYYHHPIVGFMYARLQTWFPFSLQIGFNGREWLARQLTAAGVRFRQTDNCIHDVADWTQAQACLDAQLTTNWTTLLDEMRSWVHPIDPEFLGRYPTNYYWSLAQSEWATDLVFADRAALQSRYGPWLRHALTSYDRSDVLRFMGWTQPARCRSEVLSHLAQRGEGIRLKHRSEGNSIKMYDKAGGTVLRAETTINRPNRFRVFRTAEGDPEGPKSYRPLRVGVADIHRRAEVSQGANERYLAGLEAVVASEPLKAVTAGLGERVREPGAGGRQVRGLNLLAGPDAAVLEVIGRPEFVVNGVRNRDIVAGLYGTPTADAADKRRRSARVTRLLRILRGHGLIHKVPRTHLYRVSERGRQVITAVLAARNASTERLVASAA